tara:strand:- start:1362 stop:1772 length:411 start_codon:yes stop_codon:yes gene_type:complete
MSTDKYIKIIEGMEFPEDTFDGLIGHKLVQLQDNYVETKLEINESHLQPFGLVHGGVYSAMAESAISYGASINQKSIWAGVNNNTDFIASATTGTLILKAKPIKLGKRSQLWEAEIFNKNILCAKSTVRMTNLGNK